MQQAPCTAPGEAASAIVFNAFRARTLVETKSVHLGLAGLMSGTVPCFKLVTTMATLTNCTVSMTTSGKTAGDCNPFDHPGFILLSSKFPSTIHTPNRSTMKLMSQRFTERECFLRTVQLFLRAIFISVLWPKLWLRQLCQD